jgi:hypothetical protein
MTAITAFSLWIGAALQGYIDKFLGHFGEALNPSRPPSPVVRRINNTMMSTAINIRKEFDDANCWMASMNTY